MNRIDLMIDFETMGSNAQNCAVIDCSTIVFDWGRFLEKPYSFEELLDISKRYKLSIIDQVKKYGFKVEEDTVDFWSQQTEDVRKMIKPKKSDLTVEHFTKLFINDLKKAPKIEYWWSRNNTFDPTVLWRLMWTQQSKYTINEYLMHWRVRDIKTWVDAKFDFSTPNGFVPISDQDYWNETFMRHNSTHDAAADVLRLQAIYRAENDLGMIEK